MFDSIVPEDSVYGHVAFLSGGLVGQNTVNL